MNENCKYFDEYYDYLLEKVEPSDKVKKVVFNIIRDLTDRRGLRQEFEQIDGDIQTEIVDKWIELISETI